MSYDYLEALLKTYPDARIQLTIDNEVILQGDIDESELVRFQQVYEGGLPYVDEFGFYVYVAPALSLQGDEDKDLRLENCDIKHPKGEGYDIRSSS